MEQFSDIVDEALLNVQSNLDASLQQESDENQEEKVNDLVNSK